MLKHFTAIALLFVSVCSFAQKPDSIFVAPHEGGWAVVHRVKAGEQVMSLSRRYYAPPAMVADANKVGFQQQLTAGSTMLVPLGAYNYLKAKPAGNDFRPLYVKAGNDPLYKIARATGVSQRQLQDWNMLPTTEVKKGQVLLIGWIRFDQTNLQNSSTPKNNTVSQGIKVEEEDPMNRKRHGNTIETIYIPMPDTLTKPADTLSEGEEQFLAQTQNGAVKVDEKGSAAFFQRAGKSENGIYFAFHNTARRGTIIKIFNPGTEKTVYAKVIGKIPTRDIFYNTILGISSDARAELETGGDKVWCEISYAP